MLAQTPLAHIAQVRARKIAWDGREVVQNGLNSDCVVLDLDPEWSECDRVQAILMGAGDPIRVLVEDRCFGIPSTLMERTGTIRMCLVGYMGETARIVTAKEAKPLVVVESGQMGGIDPAPEQPDLWAQLMEEVRKATDGAKTAAQSATRAEADLRAAAERGDFDGEDGKTPVRGVDYWTAEDRKPIEDATLAATTAAGRADAATATTTEGEASRVAAEAERANAEAARAKAEQARVVAETGRVEAENGRVNADAERGERVDAAVQKADAATAKATEAAGKADASATEADAAAKRADEAAKGASENVLVGTKTAGVVHVEDAWPTPLRECKVLGKSEQTVTTGSQLFRPIGTETVNGVAFTAEADGSYRVKGKQDKAFTRVFSDSGAKVPLSGYGIKPGDTIYLSCAGASAKCYACIQFFSDGSDSYTMVAVSSAVSTYKVPETMTRAFCFISLDGTVGTSVDVELRPMLSKSRDVAWEPYTGAKPSPSPKYPQPIASIGKTELMVTGRNLARSFKSAPHQSRWAGVLFIDADLMPSTTYTLSFSSTASNSYYINEALFDNFQTITPSGGRTSVKLVTKSGIDKNIAGQHNAQGWVILKNNKEQDHAPSFTDVQLEFGEVATGFVPYSGAIHTIDLQGNELRSLPNGVHDEVVVSREGNASLIKRIGKTVYDGSPDEVWFKNGEGDNECRFITSIGGKAPGLGIVAELIISDRFMYPSMAERLGSTSVEVTMGKDIIPTLDVGLFAAWLAENPVTFVYQLAEPQTIPLGKVSVPALPESTSNVWNADAISTDVSATYVRDVTLAFDALESKLTQAVVATAANL